jgi:hypothetical protein
MTRELQLATEPTTPCACPFAPFVSASLRDADIAECRFCHFSDAKSLAIIFRGARRHAVDRLIGKEF